MEIVYRKNKIFGPIFLLLFLVSASFNLFFYRQLRAENIVTEVVDGDTFQLKSGKRVRLLGVDAPEYDRCGGKEAKQRLKELILDQRVKLAEETPEAFGRALALVWRGPVLVNQLMLEEGWARTDYRKNSRRDQLTAAFHLAQKEKRGIFGDLCRQENIPTDENCLIKGNIDLSTYQKFYHLPGCRHYEEIVIEKDRGERYFCSEQEASAAGFKKAAGCP